MYVLDRNELRGLQALSALSKILPNFFFCIAYLGIFSMLLSSINKIILISLFFNVVKVVILQNFFILLGGEKRREGINFSVMQKALFLGSVI